MVYFKWNNGYRGCTEKFICIDLCFPFFVLGAEQIGFELVEKLFQGQLVLRTRCLECESLTERREDFQDIIIVNQTAAKRNKFHHPGNTEKALSFPRLASTLDR